MLTAYQRLMVIGYSVSGLLNATTWLAILGLVDHTSLVTILHYNIYFGPDSFGNWYELLMLPGIGLAIIVINAGLATWVWKIDRFLAYVVVVGNVFSQLVMVVATALIVNMNRV